MHTNSDDHLLDVEFDLNPLKKKEDKQKVDQRIRLRLLPVQVVYDDVSIHVQELHILVGKGRHATGY